MGQVRIHCHLTNRLGSPENQTALRRKTLYPLQTAIRVECLSVERKKRFDFV